MAGDSYRGAGVVALPASLACNETSSRRTDPDPAARTCSQSSECGSSDSVLGQSQSFPSLLSVPQGANTTRSCQAVWTVAYEIAISAFRPSSGAHE
ncbi:hypothetical protein EYF80_019376 [Liparis tanakae]|uniref:Uncharacterized protein n=1 Tax=Liparis tanakae TaxID=230148 RepID=A0A4Z2HXU4_9TELE|nr:hypothetical protein EYF80_019376 [Liparis tanakae]